MKRRHLICLLLLLGCRKEAAPPGEEKHAPAPVRAVAAEKMSLGEWTELLGTTQPLPAGSAKVTALVEGRVLHVLGDGAKSVSEGDLIAASQVIAQLDDRILRSNRDKLNAGLVDADEQIRQAQLARDLAKIEVKRLKDLGGASTGNLPLVSQIELSKAILLELDAESKEKSAQAKKASLKAEIDGLAAQLDAYTLRSPIAGRLGLLQVVPGQTLSVGTVVAEVVDLTQIDVYGLAAPSTAAKVAVGQPAKLGDAVGTVVYVAVQAQPETGAFAIKVRFPNPDLKLRANSIVRIAIATQPEKERLVVPEVAVMEDATPPYVLTADEVKTVKSGDHEERIGKVEKLIPKLGIRDREKHVIEILGLRNVEKKEDEPVDHALFIVEGGQGLRDDDEVKVEAA
ncbi:MAG TPA: HlyD family efflux transporter periplasmic adaptor subunit, partial [Gemmataceae bacterium]|nr:HlyD family efflux transporter periplasmic adaptor subunit [Gemmataceae bacterium]